MSKKVLLFQRADDGDYYEAEAGSIRAELFAKKFNFVLVDDPAIRRKILGSNADPKGQEAPEAVPAAEEAPKVLERPKAAAKAPKGPQKGKK